MRKKFVLFRYTTLKKSYKEHQKKPIEATYRFEVRTNAYRVFCSTPVGFQLCSLYDTGKTTRFDSVSTNNYEL